LKTKYGFPVVDSENIFQILKDRGIEPWPHAMKPMPLAEYMAGNLTVEMKKEAERFAPKSEVVFLLQPDGKIFNGFRVTGEDGVIAFTILEDDLVVIVADFVHGGEIVRLNPPAGFYRSGGRETALSCAKREVLEETGIVLKDNEISPLADSEGICDEPRRLTMKEYYFLARPGSPVTISPARPDATEFLQTILIPLKEWLKLIESGKVKDSTSITATALALFKIVVP